jgi:hypothetical protein
LGRFREGTEAHRKKSVACQKPLGFWLGVCGKPQTPGICSWSFACKTPTQSGKPDCDPTVDLCASRRYKNTPKKPIYPEFTYNLQKTIPGVVYNLQGWLYNFPCGMSVESCRHPKNSLKKEVFMKIKQLCPALLVLAGMVLVLTACFSPWQGGEGTLTIQLGNSSRVGINAGEQNTFTHTITLTGQGQTITQTFPAGATTATFNVLPGTWNVVVKGRGATPRDRDSPYIDGTVGYNPERFPAETMLRSYGEDTVTIGGGNGAAASIEMYSAVEVANGDQLIEAFYMARKDDKEYVFVTGNITVDDTRLGLSPLVGPGQNIELRAEKPVRIERVDGYDGSLFFVDPGGKLTLGKAGETHQYLNISGDIGGADQDDEPNARAPLIQVVGGDVAGELVQGELILNSAMIGHNRVALDYTDGSAPGVYVNGGIFTMRGGLIHGNTDNGDGGGVKVDSNGGPGGTFEMSGGEIASCRAAYGGQVYIGQNCTFTMTGGTISNSGGSGSPTDTQSNYGAGVFVLAEAGADGIFTKTGGTIYGSSPVHAYNLRARTPLRSPTDASVEVGGGDAVYFGSETSPSKVRNATLGPDKHLSTVEGGLGYANWDYTW